MAAQIVAVRTVTAIGASHPHISHVKTADGRILERAAVIRNINNGWESYFTMTLWGTRAQVIVVECPHCGAGDYIKTTADATTADKPPQTAALLGQRGEVRNSSRTLRREDRERRLSGCVRVRREPERDRYGPRDERQDAFRFGGSELESVSAVQDKR